MNLRKLITNDWIRKLAAIVFAGLIYSAVRLQLQEQKTFERVKVKLQPENTRTVVLNEDEILVTVALRGTRRSLDQIKSREAIKIVHSIPYETKGDTYEGELKPEDVKLPRGLSVASIAPKQISVDLDTIKSKEVDILFRFDPSTLGEGRTMKRISRVAKITGPSKYVDQVRAVETKIVPYPDQMREEVAIDLIKPPRIMRMEPRTVTVTIEMEQRRDNRQFSDFPVQVMVPPSGNLYLEKFEEDPLVTFIVEGDRKDLKNLLRVHIKAYVDLSDPLLSAGPTQRRVHVWVDKPGLVVRNIEPSFLNVIIGQREARKK